VKSLQGVRKVALVLALLALLAPGCGRIKNASERVKKSNDLKQLGLMYHSYVDNHRKGPASADDLMTAMAGEPGAKAVVQMVKDGKYVLIWGTSIAEMQKNPQGSTGTVLGYEATAPTAGGLVLMGDGAVQNMTAAEFAAAPKALPVGARPDR
jgi:hypothetical protein